MKKRVYYINHGIWNKLAGKNFSKNTRSVDWTHFDGYFVTKNEKIYLNRIGIPDKKIHIINGSPQIDYLLSNSLSQKKRLFYRNISRKTGNIEPGTKYPLSLKKPCVLLVQNPDALNNLGRNKKDEPLVLDEYYKILKTLVKLSVTHNFHIITKFKKDTSTTVKRFKKALPLHKHKNVSVLYYSDQVLLYDLFFANVVIIEGFGTSFLESLMVNPKTVQCQILKHNDDLDIDRYDLLQADSQRHIISMIPSLIRNNSLITKEYMQSRKQYIEDQLGPLQRNISRFVTNTIRSEIVSK
jgi:hypothetical protein